MSFVNFETFLANISSNIVSELSFPLYFQNPNLHVRLYHYSSCISYTLFVFSSSYSLSASNYSSVTCFPVCQKFSVLPCLIDSRFLLKFFIFSSVLLNPFIILILNTLYDYFNIFIIPGLLLLLFLIVAFSYLVVF